MKSELSVTQNKQRVLEAEGRTHMRERERMDTNGLRIKSMRANYKGKWE